MTNYATDNMESGNLWALMFDILINHTSSLSVVLVAVVAMLKPFTFAFGTFTILFLFFIVALGYQRSLSNTPSTLNPNQDTQSPTENESNEVITLDQQLIDSLAGISKALNELPLEDGNAVRAIMNELGTTIQSCQKMRNLGRFHQFALLPPELRVMIWKEAAKAPQLTHLWEDGCITITNWCQILHVNHEARVEAQRARRNVYGGTHLSEETKPRRLDGSTTCYCEPRGMGRYIDLDIDTVWIHGIELLSYCVSDWSGIKRLAIDYNAWLVCRHSPYSWPGRFEEYIMQMQLEELIFVVDFDCSENCQTAEITQSGRMNMLGAMEMRSFEESRDYLHAQKKDFLERWSLEPIEEWMWKTYSTWKMPNIKFVDVKTRQA
ncbi:hypothetical protein N431DRAFT_551631 [Stipitochalara longipes BDJ]|nr:hypothetical protein N431DRAFT_551631 [Stipitochalara longipes BDJ]